VNDGKWQVYEKAKRDCPLQKEISRRELFRRMTSTDDP
jgi:hypothetical protein